ncbi:hypothetical protein [Polymorphum gilvum]|uniref:Uncharacterized protein n=1 Tax=Polymorphum gilvum (strain LMG 25793 / CGMCC 1.9160 / SL003B-26A1) TaxID=991905 RepID=F2IUQ7_POLGS|nr:hypothetical protein [Polymorphum gilvum]ADZ69111.1 hypothetical protein SL003B_0679 [Polymorphum gilvum SL003B-26A1]
MDDFIMLTLTDIHLQRLHAEAARLAEDTDDPDDWDAWKEADGVATGFKLALQEVAREAANPEPTPPMPAISYDDWLASNRPVRNTIRTDAPFDGLMFETFGPELDAVKAADPACVWTLVSGDDDDGLYLLSGFHFVNRLGYLITECPRAGEGQLAIRLD